MKYQPMLKVAFALALTAWVTQPGFAQNPTHPLTKWEYKILTTCNNPEGLTLQDLGEQGWEMVAATDSNGSCPIYHFKRPAGPAAIQPPSARPAPVQCNLTLAQAPVIRGLRLGRSVQDLLALFPGSIERPDVRMILEKAKLKDYGSGSLSIDLNSYSTRENFAGINSVRVGFLDEQVTYIEVYYLTQDEAGQPLWESVDEWVATLSEKLALPAADWERDGGGKVLRCSGFEISSYQPGNLRLRNPAGSGTPRARFKAEQKKKQQAFKP